MCAHPVCILIFIFYCYSIFIIWTYNLMSVYVCMWFSKPSRLPVYIYIYACACGFLSCRGCLYIYMYASVYIYMYIHNSILLLSPFLRLSLLSLFPFLFLMLVCYTHVFHVVIYKLDSAVRRLCIETPL